MIFGNVKALAGKALGLFTDHKVSQWLGYIKERMNVRVHFQSSVGSEKVVLKINPVPLDPGFLLVT